MRHPTTQENTSRRERLATVIIAVSSQMLDKALLDPQTPWQEFAVMLDDIEDRGGDPFYYRLLKAIHIHLSLAVKDSHTIAPRSGPNMQFFYENLQPYFTAYYNKTTGGYGDFHNPQGYLKFLHEWQADIGDLVSVLAEKGKAIRSKMLRQRLNTFMNKCKNLQVSRAGWPADDELSWAGQNWIEESLKAHDVVSNYRHYTNYGSKTPVPINYGRPDLRSEPSPTTEKAT